MFKTLKNAWGIPDLRKKILFTLFIIMVFRFGAVIPVPFLNVTALKGLMNTVDKTGSALSYLDMLSGGAFANGTLFAMSVTPYINSSIIMQLLTVAIPALERLAKEGEEGRKRIATYTRYVTVALGLIQGTAYYFYLRNSSYQGTPIAKYTKGWQEVFAAFVIIMVFTAGTALMMWLGEQINQHGIGNGISILLFAGIVARMPHTINLLGQYIQAANQDPSSYGKYYFFVPLFVIVFLIVIWVIVFMNDAERRIPVQYAKRMVGRKMYGGQSSHIPIKVGMSGVMPIIFASSILSIPSTIQLFLGQRVMTGFWKSFFDAFSTTGVLYSLVYFLLIIMFAYFYVTIQYNPIEMANNLRQNNGTIPGIRPGKPTSDYIARILSKITLIGALFLAVIALLPIIFGAFTGMHNMMIGGTSILILVGVALETVKQMESQMMMRHYKGFLD
ncbi:preprotein translocase subunit SecY [Caproiciproducens galactitolivorans]|uniref:Protein translocase subunit SecY n=1 Tax=Caproiciproducens galactitolivorans TaxID=642589 RepID=A0ABT4BUA3_9FIRM|nr:preprotein translocase subunit SecY [Caproiciproducens galactitolivorans]MCY1713905.1 preprotein translocase subunit SecY [Caproiciproducens galactitolivorans]